MIECTWKNCTKEAEFPQKDKNGNQWANLCSEHFIKLEDTLTGKNFSAKKSLQAWILASGGAKKMI